MPRHAAMVIDGRPQPTTGVSMSQPLARNALDQAFFEARTAHKFTDQPVTDETLHALVDLCKWGPTSLNCQPMRLVFVRGADAKARLAPTLSGSNRDKTLAAPVTVIVAYDREFHERLPELFPAFDARGVFAKAPELIEPSARTSATLQAGYLILAARALGLDAGPMTGFDADAVDQAFFADKRLHSLLLVNLGYGVREGAAPRGPRLAFDEVAHIV